MQKLLVLQSLWSMEDLQPGRERSLEENVRLIAEAGFDGIGAAWTEPDAAARVAALARGHGLVVEGVAFPRDVDGLKPVLELGAAHGLHHLNIQPDVRPRSQREAVAILEGWQRLAEQVAYPVNIETHRNKLTNDLLVLLDLLDSLPALRLTADLSHLVVAREVPLPVPAEIEAQIRAVLDRSFALHGRVSTASQVQVPFGFAQHAPWLAQYRDWWRWGMQSWRARAGTDAALPFLCELGPRPYALSGADGGELSDRWAESRQLAAIARALWADPA
ncbi:sugar phosphate isomerase/epimerase [Labrys wisconsinensis]|uniref:Xylose isomerase n=1 Tax=Labrys wisconsinensis TaxID=425677 RepID=A0ABU0JLY4_9HYPH|nr:sugar phosphate isomerase/epimerase [Labrys wisconsinensis]MDQ0475312.1 hypothetical protein [Labrys wisconsinensis]